MTETPRFPTSRKPNGARTRRYILAVIIFLALALIATHTFLHRTSVGGKNFVRMTFTIYTVTVLIVLALLILATILGRNLIKLYFERKSGQLGSGFKTKMVRTFIVLSLLPALLLFMLAYSLISSSIDKWFGAPPAQMMENSRLLANQYYAEAEERANYYAGNIARILSLGGGFAPEKRHGATAKAGRNIAAAMRLTACACMTATPGWFWNPGIPAHRTIAPCRRQGFGCPESSREVRDSMLNASVPQRSFHRNQLGNGPHPRCAQRYYRRGPDRIRSSAERQVPGGFGNGSF